MAEKYINPLTDYGFKKIFGNHDIMVDFLNDVIEPASPITNVVFLDKEMSGENVYEKGVIYDLRCRTSIGEEFLVEMQKGGQRFFAERMVYYMSRSIASQGYKGKKKKSRNKTRNAFVNWNFELQPVYGVFLLDFHLKGLRPLPFRTVCLDVKQTGETFCDKMMMYTIELPDFRNMKESDCKINIEYWNYIMTHLEKIEGRIPFLDKKPIFDKLASIARLSMLDKDEFRRYQDSIDTYRSNKAAWDFRYEEGFAKGAKKSLKKGIGQGQDIERRKIAKAMKKKGIPDEIIASCTNLTIEEIKNFKVKC